MDDFVRLIKIRLKSNIKMKAFPLEYQLYDGITLGKTVSQTIDREYRKVFMK